MNRELLKQVVVGIDALIAEELKSEEQARYQRIEQLCLKAHDLLQMGTTRVDEVVDDFGYGMIARPRQGRIRIDNGVGQAWGQQNDMVDILREMLPAFAPKQQGFEIRNVDQLIDIREKYKGMGRDTTKIDAKIERGLRALEEDHVEMADSELLRGYSVRGNEQGHLRALDGETDPPRGGGSEEAHTEGGEERLDRG